MRLGERVQGLPLWARRTGALALMLAVFGAGMGAEYGLNSRRAAQAAAAAKLAEEAAAAQTPAMQLRIYDGQVEWNDGVYWHPYADTDVLAAADPFASVTLPALPADGQPQAGTAARSHTEGEVPVPKATAKPSQGKSQSGTAAANASGGDAGAGAAVPEAPAVPSAPETPSVPQTQPDASAGDGENIEWSGDVL